MVGAVRTRHCGCLGFVTLVFLFLGTSGRGVYGLQQEDPEAIAPKAPSQSRLLILNQTDAYLELQGDYTHREVDTNRRSGTISQQNREWRVQERLGLTLGGSLIDPRFINFNTDLSLALTQQRFTEDSDFADFVDRDNGYLLRYDARMNFFQGQPVSGSVYGLRQEDRISRRFQSTLNQRRTGFGTSWQHTTDALTMELAYDYLETDRTGNADPRDDEHFTESRLRYGGDWRISEQQKLIFSYENATSKQAYQGSAGDFETTRDLLSLEHEWMFGPENRHELRTVLHWQEESGDFARDFFEIGPQLTLKHSDDLETLYKYQFNRERFEGLDVETQRLDFQLVHQAYTNLTTIVDVFGLYEDVENDINTTQYGASVDWQYNRRNRFGHLYANLAFAYDTEQVSGDNGERVILDESHTFRDPVNPVLRNRNVIVRTVVVTDPSNRRVFLRGVDYRVVIQGNAVQLERIETGRIADGDTVLVDYLFRTPADGQLDTMRTDFTIEQRFANGLTPYYRLSFRNQEDNGSSGFLRRADRTNHHRLGVNYQAKRYSLGFEYEIFDDTVDPYDAFHVRGRWGLVRKSDDTLNLATRFSRLLFEGGVDSRNVNLMDVSLDRRRRLSDSVSTIERAAFRWEDDSVAGMTKAWDVTAGLEFVVGDLLGELTVEYDRLSLPKSEEDNFGVYVRVRREFTNVLRTQ